MQFVRFLELAGLAYAVASDIVEDASPNDECTNHLDAVEVPLEGAVMFQMDQQAYKAEETERSVEEKPEWHRQHHDVTRDSQIAGPHVSLLGMVPADIVAKYGDKRCPCIGLENLVGTNVVRLNENQSAVYPLDAGSFCEAWDNGIHPDCRPSGRFGLGGGFCPRSWCFVDPCDCDLEIWPSKASRFAPVTFHKKPLYFSYETCSSVDVPEESMPEPIYEEMCEQKVEGHYGNPNCTCIGFDNLVSVTSVFKKGLPMTFPPNTGSSCQAWDEIYDEEHCKRNENPPEYCSQPYCFVDPCSCSLPSQPSAWFWGTKWKGHTVYYSYDTCGGVDYWSEPRNDHTKIHCDSYSYRWWCQYHEECGWNGTHCMDIGQLTCVDAFRDSGAGAAFPLSVPMAASLLLAWL